MWLPVDEQHFKSDVTVSMRMNVMDD